VKVPYLVHEVLVLSPSRNYLLLNCYHNLCAVNYTITHALAPKHKLLLVHDKRRSVAHWPLQSEIGMLLITNFLVLGGVAARAISRQVANIPSTCHHPAAATTMT
jgi:hypothetical protein